MAARSLSRWEHRLLVVGVVLLLLVVMFLLIHFVFMPHHDDAGPCGSCAIEMIIELAVVVSVVARATGVFLSPARPAIPRQPARAFVAGTPTPGHGAVLRL